MGLGLKMKTRTKKIILCFLLNDAIILWYLLSNYYFNLSDTITTYSLKLKETISSLEINLDDSVWQEALVQAAIALKWLILVMVVVMLIYHALVYFSFFKNKSWSKTYLVILAWSGVVLGGLFVVGSLISASFEFFYVLPLPFLYLYAALSLKKPRQNI